MSKTMKIEEALYDELDRYRGKGETFSHALTKVLQAATGVVWAAKSLGFRPSLVSGPSPQTDELWPRVPRGAGAEEVDPSD